MRGFFIDSLLVRIHFIIVMIRWTGLTRKHHAEEGNVTDAWNNLGDLYSRGHGCKKDVNKVPLAAFFFFFFITLKPRVE